MLTESTGAAGAPGAAKGMAEYLAKESHVAGLSEKLAKYYGYGLMSDEGYTTAGIPQRDMHPAIAGLLKIDPSKPLSTMEVAHLLAGQCTDGSDIPGKQKQTKNKIRISYIDFTLSAPKSLSIAISLATSEGMHAEAARLDNCHTIAVDKTLKMIAETVGTVSKGKTTKNFQRDKGHVAIVKFEHNTARPIEKIARIENGIHVTELKDVGAGADMNRHTHGIMMAVAITDEGRVGSVHQQAMKGRIHEWGSIYQAILATELRRIGVETELDRRGDIDFNGRMARLTAIPQRISDLFSKRTTNGRETARKHAADRGLDYDAMSPDDKSKYIDVSMNRTKKVKGDEAVDVQVWRAEAKAAGFSYRSVLRPGQEREPAPIEDRHRNVYETSLPLLETQFGKRSVIEGAVARVAAAKGFIEHGINDPSELNAITAAYRTEGVRQDGEMTKVHFAFDPAEKYARITTQLSVDQEQEAIGILHRASLDKSGALPPALVQRAVDVISAKGYNFTEGHGLKQREVIDKLAASGRASVAVGIAGSGKTSLMMPLVEAWHQTERDVYGVTLGWRQTTGLKDAGIGWKHKRKKPSIEPDTSTLVEAGVDESKTYAMTGFLTRLKMGVLTLTPNSVVVIDEIALVGTKQMLDLARYQKEHGFQIVGIGDDKQGQSLAAGASIDLMRRAFGADNVPELISTIRQYKDRDKETSLLFRQGKADEALARKDEDGTVNIVAGGYEEAINATVDLWFERKAANRDRTDYTLGISVPTNVDGLAIGEEIRRRRMAAKEIKPAICEIDAVDQNGAKFPLALSVGDSVRLFNRVFGKDADGHNGFVGNNGSVVEVAGADAKHLIVRKANGGIATVEWDDIKEDAYERRQRKKKGLPPPEKDARIRLTRGDAITIDARQSETLSEHITAMPSGSSLVNGFKAYVAESRQREMSWIITSQGAEMMEVQTRRAIGDPRNEDTDPANVKADILKNMGRNLSRQPTKTLATDFMERAVHLRSGSIGAMRAAWHRQETREADNKPPLAIAAKIEARAEAGISLPGLTQAFEATRFGPPVDAAPTSTTPASTLTKHAGWKLHLNVPETTDNPVTRDISEWLMSQGIAHKIGHNGGQIGKGMTVYVGAYAKARGLADELENRFRLPYADQLSEDVRWSKCVNARFDAAGDREFHQYGIGGIPLLQRHIQDAYSTIDHGFNEKNAREADAILVSRYGAFYGPGVYQAASTPSQTPVSSMKPPQSNLGKELDQTAGLIIDGSMNFEDAVEYMMAHWEKENPMPTKEEWNNWSLQSMTWEKNHWVWKGDDPREVWEERKFDARMDMMTNLDDLVEKKSIAEPPIDLHPAPDIRAEAWKATPRQSREPVVRPDPTQKHNHTPGV